MQDANMEAQALKLLRQTIVSAAAHAGEGHIPSALSILDILWVLYAKVLRVDPHTITEDRDRFVLSKGHASLALYAVLGFHEFFSLPELRQFGKFSSFLGGHPDSTRVPGVEASTGSLGHGFPLAVGLAMGLKMKKSGAQVFCLVGDGECNEGSIWEAAMLADHHQLSNLHLIVDFNHSTDRALRLGNLSKKFEAFGFDTQEVDGHDHRQILDALQKSHVSMPRAIVAHTIKGKGIKCMENNPAWHHKAPKLEELRELLGEIS